VEPKTKDKRASWCSLVSLSYPDQWLAKAAPSIGNMPGRQEIVLPWLEMLLA